MLLKARPFSGWLVSEAANHSPVLSVGMEESVELGSHILQRPLTDFCLRQLPLTTLAGLRLVSKAIRELVDHETGHIWLEAAGQRNIAMLTSL